MCSSITICPWHRRREEIIQSDFFTAKVCHSLCEAELKVGHPNVGLSDLTIVGSKRPIIMLDKLDYRRTHLCLFSDSVYYFLSGLFCFFVQLFLQLPAGLPYGLDLLFLHLSPQAFTMSSELGLQLDLELSLHFSLQPVPCSQGLFKTGLQTLGKNDGEEIKREQNSKKKTEEDN